MHNKIATRPHTTGTCAIIPANLSIDYAIDSTQGAASSPLVSRDDWRLGLFGCFQVQDCGMNCCCAHFCCGPCVYADTMALLGIRGAYKAAVTGIVAGALNGSRSEAGQIFGGAFQFAAVCGRARVRQRLYAKLFPVSVAPSTTVACCTQCWCAGCAQMQEVDAVMTYAAEGAGKPLRFGDVTALDCARLYEVETGRPVVALPQPAHIERL